MSNIVMLLCS